MVPEVIGYGDRLVHPVVLQSLHLAYRHDIHLFEPEQDVHQLLKHPVMAAPLQLVFELRIPTSRSSRPNSLTQCRQNYLPFLRSVRQVVQRCATVQTLMGSGDHIHRHLSPRNRPLLHKHGQRFSQNLQTLANV